MLGNTDVKNLSERERCVLCGGDTPVEKGADLDSRLYYCECCGQLCRACYQALLQGEPRQPEQRPRRGLRLGQAC